MTLKDQIFQDFVTAMKNKDSLRKNILGNIKTKIVISEKTQEVTDKDVITFIQKEVNNLKATIEFEGIKEDLRNQALAEKNILDVYLPSQMTESEIRVRLIEGLKSWKIEKNIGSIMRFSKDNFQGKFDMSELSEIAKSIIS